MPKQKGKTPEDLIHKRLQKKSPWYQSIMDPMHGADAKIPDETGVETGTCQLVERFTILTNADGVCGCRVLSPYINNVKHEPTQVVAGSNIQYLSSTSDELTLHWGSNNGVAGAWLDGSALPFEAIGGMQQITNQHRIVSACLMIQPEVAMTSNDGEMCMFLNDFTTENSGVYNDYVNNYKSVTIPISANNNCGMVRWYPVARNDWNFKSFIRTDATDMSEDDAEATGISCPPWNFGTIVTTKEEGSRFRVTVVVNYEFIPKDNVLNVLDTSPSPQDTMEVDLVERWVQDAPLAAPVHNKVPSTSPSSVQPEQGTTDSGTGFGMFFNVISELAPLALALL